MASTPERAAGTLATAVVNDRGAERLRGGHPWVYAGDVLGWEPAAPAGAGVARLRDRRGKELGIADFSPQSTISLRRLDANAGPVVDSAFFRGRLEAAVAYRARLGLEGDAGRLVASEADGLPGLIVDRYGPALVVQTLTAAMAGRQPSIVRELQAMLAPTAIVERNDSKVREREGLEVRAGLLSGASPRVRVRMHNLELDLDLLTGQKTGAFLDQRENWAAVEDHARLAGCADALDVFTYQGGFALHLARACAHVEAVDSSRPALEAADHNAALNHLDKIDWVEANAFDLLRDYDRADRRFDLVVLDPPAFAKSRAALATAAAGYKEINLRALKILRPGGLLVTCSCSHHLSEAHLLEVVAAAARDARRELILRERRTQAADHPVLLAMPESSYLKCLIFQAR